MEERKYTLRLTREELFIVQFELERTAEQHDQNAASTSDLVKDGYGTPKNIEYWREQAALCRRVAEKAEATMDAGPGLEAINPVKRGRWEIVCNEDTAYIKMYRCSCCKDEFMLDEGEIEENGEYNYCPNCGAAMDEKGGT